MMQNIMQEKNRMAMPQLSEDQKANIERKLIIAFYENNTVSIEYFYNGKIQLLKDQIKKIDSTYHKIYFNKQVLLFDQIINVI